MEKKCHALSCTENESQLLEGCLLDEWASPLTGEGDKTPICSTEHL